MIKIGELEVFFLNEYDYLGKHKKAKELLNKNINKL